MCKIIVIGSSNMDLTACVEALPGPGETVGGARFMQAHGGKGANQAVTIGRLGGEVLFLTCLGADAYGAAMLEAYERDHIRTSYIKTSPRTATGTALIMVDHAGENSIAVAPGANDELQPTDVDALDGEFETGGFLLLQLEIPMPTVCHAVEKAVRRGTKVVLNPAPVSEIPKETLRNLYLITPNRTEAERLTGIPVSTLDDAGRAADTLLAAGVGNVIITLGSQGSLVCTHEGKELIPARTVVTVDTTAAGDVYNGALVTALSEGASLRDAALFATKASAISVTRRGAQPSVPYKEEIQSLS